MNKIKDFKIENNNGSTFSFHDYQGNNSLIILFFRGAWCNYCKKQLQEVEKNISKLNDKNIKFLALSSDTKMNSSVLKTFLKLSFPVLSDPDFTIINDYKLKVTYKDKDVSKPAIFIYNQQHEEVFQIIGENYEDRLSAEALLETINNLNL